MIRRPVLSLGHPLPRPLVLIVEDEPVMRLAARTLVSLVCHTAAAVACNGQEALDDVQHAEFDLILMDLQMPVLDGLEAARRIRELEHRLKRDLPAPIVAYTSNLSGLTLQQLRQSGINDLLEKPAGLERMKDCFDTWCRGRVC
jgi:CheY-like chemotaxis protein